MFKSAKNYAFYAVLFLYPAICFSQEQNYYLFKRFDSESGLKQNIITGMVLGKSGFLWVATMDGLARFDGESIGVYNFSNSLLKSNKITALSKDKFGNIYTYDAMSNIHLIDETPPQITFKLVSSKVKNLSEYYIPRSLKDTLTQFKVSAFLRDSFERNYISSGLNGANYYRNYTTHINNQDFYIFHRPKEFLIFDYAGNLVQSAPTKIDIAYNKTHCISGCLVEFSDNLIYVYSILRKRYHVFKNHSLRGAISELPTNANYVKDHLSDKLYVVIGQKVYKLNIDISLNCIKIEYLVTLPERSKVTAIYSDSISRSLYVGTETNGLYIYKKSIVKTYNNFLYGTGSYYAFVKSNETNQLFTSSLNGHVLQFSASGSTSVLKPVIPTTGNMLRLEQNRYLFVPSNSSIYKVDIKKNVMFEYLKAPDTTNFSFQEYFAGYGEILATQKSVCLRKRPDTTLKVIYYSSSGLDFRSALRINDSLIYFTSISGLYLLNTNSNGIITLPFFDSLETRGILKVGNGFLVTVKGYGLFYVSKNKSVQLPLDKNNVLLNGHCIFYGRDSMIYITTNKGLISFGKAAFLDYVKGNYKNKINYLWFSQHTGIRNTEYNGGCNPCMLKDNNRFIFPSVSGLQEIDEGLLSALGIYSPLYFDSIVIDNVKLSSYKLDKIKLLSHAFNLSIFPAGGSWDGYNISYCIQSDTSLTKIWIPIFSPENGIKIQNISGGKHYLTILKENEGVTYEKRIEITVPFRIYEYVVFWLFVLIVLILLIYLSSYIYGKYLRIQKEKLERLINEKTNDLREALTLIEKQYKSIEEYSDKLSQENRLKTLLLYILSHDVSSPIRFISMYLSKTASKNRMELTLKDITDISVSLVNVELFLASIVAWLKKSDSQNNNFENIFIYELIDNQLISLSLLIENNNNLLANRVSKDDKIVSDPFVLSVILQNVIGNAVNYTRNGVIYIESYAYKSFLSIVVLNQSNSDRITELEWQLVESNSFSTDIYGMSKGMGIGLRLVREMAPLINVRVVQFKGSKSQAHKVVIVVPITNIESI